MGKATCLNDQCQVRFNGGFGEEVKSAGLHGLRSQHEHSPIAAHMFRGGAPLVCSYSYQVDPTHNSRRCIL
ncbi:hypothetical protein IG631_04983 [Alternaria alternata]|nr:hypothetical protein IG631_04983 [Alternaria alternata]